MHPEPDDQPPIPFNLDQLLERLGSREKAVRDQAIHDACALPPTDLLELLRLYRRQSKRRDMWLRVAMVSLIAGQMPLAWFLNMTASKNVVMPFLVWMIWSPIAVGFLSNRTRGNLAQILSKVDDPHLFGPMLHFIVGTEIGDDPKMKRSIQKAAMRLLPRLRAEHVVGWTAEERRRLSSPLLYRAQNPAEIDIRARRSPNAFLLRFQLLKALEQIGDEREIEVVRKLATMNALTPKAKELQTAAQECLSYLSVRVEQQRQERMLLRASTTPTTGAETLLRPASAQVVEAPAEQLLRPQDAGTIEENG